MSMATRTALLLISLLLPLSALGGVDGSPDAWSDPDLTMQYTDTVDGCEWWATDWATGQTVIPPQDTPSGVATNTYVIDIGQFIDSGLEIETHARCFVIDPRDGASRIYSVEADTLVRNFLAPPESPTAPLLAP